MPAAAALPQDTQSVDSVALTQGGKLRLHTYWRRGTDERFIVDHDFERDEASGTQASGYQPICAEEEPEPVSGYVVELPPPLVATEFFRAAQRWDGHVLRVTPDSFIARLIPVVGEGPVQEAEIPLEELESEDRKLVEPGAVFYWSIGYQDRPSGRQKVSSIRFQRLPAWSRRELNRARDEANRLAAIFGIS